MQVESLSRGKYVARIAECPCDVAKALGLRARVFRDGLASDEDYFDAKCLHLLVETRSDGVAVACCRLLPLADGREIGRSYSAQYYDLSALEGFPGAMLELGRFCVNPDAHDPDILRVAWGALTALVDQEGIELLFGCSSFGGTDAQAHAEAFALLQDRHLAPDCWRPKIKSPHAVRFSCCANASPDRAQATAALPPLLRTYLAMGGWVSDHAVIDRDLGTLHVFTALEIAAIPQSRKRLLRAVAG